MPIVKNIQKSRGMRVLGGILSKISLLEINLPILGSLYVSPTQACPCQFWPSQLVNLLGNRTDEGKELLSQAEFIPEKQIQVLFFREFLNIWWAPPMRWRSTWGKTLFSRCFLVLTQTEWCAEITARVSQELISIGNGSCPAKLCIPPSLTRKKKLKNYTKSVLFCFTAICTDILENEIHLSTDAIGQPMVDLIPGLKSGYFRGFLRGTAMFSI